VAQCGLAEAGSALTEGRGVIRLSRICFYNQGGEKLSWIFFFFFFNSRVTTNKLLLSVIIILELAILGGVVYYKFFRSR